MTNTAAVQAESDCARESLLSEAVDEFLDRVQRGEQPVLEDYASRYPQIADELRDILPALRAMQGSAPHQPDGDPSAATSDAGCLGDFRIRREIGRGGMGVVYEAEQISLRRRVALKVLPFAAAVDARRLERFKNEALAAARLHHSNIVPVYAVGCERGVYYYAMQMIEGLSLADMIGQMKAPTVFAERHVEPANLPSFDTSHVLAELFCADAPPAPEAKPSETQPRSAAAISTVSTGSVADFFRTVARLGIQAADALEHAHGLDVVHRDIKPANLLVDARGNLWVTDFGLARLRSDVELTTPGDIVGTYRYMSPEQALGRNGVVDHRTDIYSLGATLYELLTLRPVFDGENREEVLARVASQEPIPPRRINRAIPTDLETITLKALRKEPSDRYATARELADDLRCFLDYRPIHAKKPSLMERVNKWSRRHKAVVASALLILVLAVAALAVSNVLIVRERFKTHEAYEEVARKQAATEKALADEAKQRALAEQSLRQAREMLDFFVQTAIDDLAAKDSDRVVQPTLLYASLAYYQDFIEQSHDNPKLQAQLAASHQRVAKILEAIGSTAEDRAVLEEALETQERLVRERPHDGALRWGLFSMYFHFGVLRGEMSVTIASQDAVQRHLDLRADQIEQIRSIAKSQERIRWEFCSSQGADLPAMRKKFRMHLDAASASLSQILTPGQRQRLDQIVLQRQGGWALGRPEIADELDLTASQRALILGIQEDVLHRPPHWGRARGPSLDERVRAVLTPEQRELWQQMLGPAFDVGRLRLPPPFIPRPKS
jgi:serine/threonine protein kinase